MSHFRLPIVLSLFVTASASGFAATRATSSKISPDAAAATSSNLPVIIQYKQTPSSLETFLISLLGGVVKTTLGAINALVVTVPSSGLNQLAADSNVTYISLDRAVGARQAVSVTAAEYTSEPINAPAVWQQGFIGTNIGVAVVDSGITPVPDPDSDNYANLATIFVTQGDDVNFTGQYAIYGGNDTAVTFGATVPEPASLGLLALGSLALLARRRSQNA